MHRNLAGNRFSDHVALLNAFQQFEREKFVQLFLFETKIIVSLFRLRNGERGEIEFCERKCLNLSTMRMTLEARVRIQLLFRRTKNFLSFVL